MKIPKWFVEYINRKHPGCPAKPFYSVYQMGRRHAKSKHKGRRVTSAVDQKCMEFINSRQAEEAVLHLMVTKNCTRPSAKRYVKYLDEGGHRPKLLPKPGPKSGRWK